MADFLSAPGYTLIDAWWWPYVFVLIAGYLPTEVWRHLGVVLAGDLSEDHPVLLWVRAVATALVAAVIAKLILFPTGALADSPVALRIFAAVAGFGTFMLAGSSVVFGVLVAEIILIGGWLLF